MVDYNFEDYSWIDERANELDEKFITYDPNTAIELDPRWYGVYRIRLMPVIDKRDFLVPIGVHWNVIPGTSDNPFTVFGCPKFSKNEYCPVCDAIDTAIAERRAKPENFKTPDGKNSIMVQRKFLIRALLLDFEPGEGNGKNKPPVFTDLPQLKVIKIPTLIAKELRDKAQNTKDFGGRKLFHPKEGRTIRLEKGEKLQNYWKMDVMDEYEIPEEFMNPESWPVMSHFLPDTTADQITEMIEKAKRNVHPVIVNHVLSIDVGDTQRKALPPKSSRPSTEELKNKLKNL